jgi:hypothetical protein
VRWQERRREGELWERRQEGICESADGHARAFVGVHKVVIESYGCRSGA